MLDGKKVFHTENNKTEKLKNVMVYAGNPWEAPQPGVIRELKIETKLGDINCNNQTKIDTTTTTPSATTTTITASRGRAC